MRMFKFFISLFVLLLSCAIFVFAQDSFLNKARFVMEEKDSAPTPLQERVETGEEQTSPLVGANVVTPSTFSDAVSKTVSSAKTVSSQQTVSDQAINGQSSISSNNLKKKGQEVLSQEEQKPTQTEPQDDIKWIKSSSANFDIKVEPHTRTVMTPNLSMNFETVSQVLRQNIPWMIPGKVGVSVYQDRESFLQHNQELTQDWSGAFFDPNQDRIVMYDEPQDQNHMIKKFTHELTHLFVDNTFNPPSSKAPKEEPPIWLNEGLAVNMEDIAGTPKGDVWASDLVVMNILSQGEYEALLARKKDGGLSDEEKQKLASTAVSDAVVFFQNFGDFMSQGSYDVADQQGNIDNWYLQAYAMVRFLFRPDYSSYPKNRMQFEQFTKLLSQYSPKRTKSGNVAKSSDGKTIMKKMSQEEALKKAYRYQSSVDFETDFWQWLTRLQKEGRDKIRNNL